MKHLRGGLSIPTLLRRSLTYSRGRTLAELLALTVSAAVATALLTLYGSLDAKLHREFRAFGANIVVSAKKDAGGASASSAALPADALAVARSAAGKDALVVPFAYAVAQTSSGDPVVVAGTELETARRMNPWWQVSGSLPTHSGAPGGAVPVLAGVRAARAIGASNFSLVYDGRTLPMTTAATLRTGDAEDSRIYLPLGLFTAWTAVQPGTIEVQASGNAAHVRSVITRLQQALPGADVRPVHQLIDAEAGVVTRTRSLMLSSLLLISLTVGICVLAIMTAAVLERRRDFAVMKALGATGRRVSTLFAMETLTLASAGAVCGYVLGCGIAYLIGQWNFHTSIAPLWRVVPQVALLNLLVAVLAAAIPMRALRRVEPAALLRGE